MSQPQTLLTQEQAEMLLKKSHYRLTNHDETYYWTGLFLTGESKVVDDMPTACTDGKNKYYGRAFLSKLSLEEVNALVLHENLHVGLSHVPRYRELIVRGDPYIGPAMDYAVNSVIVDGIKDKAFMKLPPNGLYDKRFEGLSVDEIRHFLMNNTQKPKKPTQPGKKGKGTGTGQGGNQSSKPEKSEDKPDDDAGRELPEERKNDDGSEESSESGEKDKKDVPKPTVMDGEGRKYSLEDFDKHDPSLMEKLTQEEAEELREHITDMLQQGAMLAGRGSAGVPRAITEALAKDVDWRAETMEFAVVSTKGQDDYTWRRFNRHRLADDLYLPSMESLTLEELVVANDVSGSISQSDIGIWGNHLYNVCMAVKPKRLRLLWWDTRVCSEQIFEESDYEDIKNLLKPEGGGGTHAGCISKYMLENKINASCLLVLTDGYTEQPVDWNVQLNVPTLWLVTLHSGFVPPNGHRMVKAKL